MAATPLPASGLHFVRYRPRFEYCGSKRQRIMINRITRCDWLCNLVSWLASLVRNASDWNLLIGDGDYAVMKVNEKEP